MDGSHYDWTKVIEENTNRSDQLSIFPNPVDDKAYIYYNLDNNNLIELSILDIFEIKFINQITAKPARIILR